MKRTRPRVIVLVLAVILLSLGLGAALFSQATALSYDGLVSRLRAQGATVTAGGDVDQPFFSVKGRIVNVNGAAVQVFEYALSVLANADAAQVAPDGMAVGKAVHIGWIADPHFYKQGRLIVIYVGGDDGIRRLLTATLGPQFAGAT